ncbi:MAG: insulinase family protein [Glaciimonas sp.]|nr:insulinase family protein [Glaciimonas sp.]
MAIVGDFDPVVTAKVVQVEFSNWKSAAQYQRVIRKNFDVTPLQEAINTPDKENGVYMARLNLDMRDEDVDYPTLLIANYLFGGSGLKSRLADRILQKDSLSYIVGSVLEIDAISQPCCKFQHSGYRCTTKSGQSRFRCQGRVSPCTQRGFQH